MAGKVVFFATGNIHKFNEARVVLAQHGLAAAMLRLKGVEIQSDSLAEIARASAKAAWKQSRLPVIVEDAGLFIDALKGFPGPYAAYVYKTIGNAGLLKQMQGVKKRKATFRSVLAYCCGDSGDVKYFEGEVVGEIALQVRKADEKSAFGFDPVFQPHGSGKTFAEMTLAEKNFFSHRAKAIGKFAAWHKTQT